MRKKIIVLLVLSILIVQAVTGQAMAMPATDIPLEEFHHWVPEVIIGGGALETVTFSNYPYVGLALLAGLEGLYLTWEGNTILPRMVDIYLAMDNTLTYEERQELKREIWRIDRDKKIKVTDIFNPLRRVLHNFVCDLYESIAMNGHYTLEEYTITEEDLINPNPGTGFAFYTGCPLGGTLTVTYNSTLGNAPTDICHGMMVADTDGSVFDKLDRWRLHSYSNRTLKLDYYESPADQIMDYYTSPNNYFGTYWDGNPYTITIADEGVYINGNLEFDAQALANPNKVRFTGHTDIWFSVPGDVTMVNVSKGMPDPVTLDDEMVLDDGYEFRQDMYGSQEFQAQIDPYSDIGTAMVVIPEGAPDTWVVGEISPAEQSVLQPIPEGVSVPYPAPEPYPDGGLGDLPVTVPDVVEPGVYPKVNNYESFKERFPFSLPWDIQRIFDMFNKFAAQPPKFYIDSGTLLGMEETGEKLEINLDLIEPYIGLIRFLIVVLFDLLLIMWVLRHYVAG